MKNKVALIGDFNEDVPAHKAIPTSIQLVAGTDIDYQWINSSDIELHKLEGYSAFWVVPASPYQSMEKVLAVIKYARTNNIPFLGTCGGYQHAALEFARNVLGYAEADNAEVTPSTQMPLISALACRLHDVKNFINLVPNSFIRSIYDTDQISEEYYCGYGVNPEYLTIFQDTELCFSGFDNDKDPRVLEIKSNTFFVGTAFQPERSALSGKSHPLIKKFIECAINA